MRKNPLIAQLALQVDRRILNTEEADYLRMDIPAHEHLACAALTLSAAKPWDGLKRFAISALVIYLGLFTITNAAAYSKIALTSLPEQEIEAPAEAATVFALDPWTGERSFEHVEAETPLAVTGSSAATHTNDDLAALLPTPASSNDRIVIPSLKINAPVVEPTLGLEAVEAKDFETLEGQIHDALLEGVVHFPGTAQPGQKGNAFLTGHSSNVFWELSDYNTVFALLPKIQVGADIIVTHNSTEYRYRVIEKKEVKPTDVSALKQGDDYHLTLVTCTPVGTTFRRLVVTAELITE